MTLRAIDWRFVRAKLRRIDELIDQLDGLGAVDAARLAAEPELVAGAIPVAVEQYREYVRQVAGFLQRQAGTSEGPPGQR